MSPPDTRIGTRRVTLLLTSETRLQRGKDGRYQSPGTIALLDSVRHQSKTILLARLDACADQFGAELGLPDDQVRALPILTIRGGALDTARMWLSVGWRTAGEADAILVVMPGQVGFLSYLMARLRRKRVGVAVVGDPWEALSEGATEHGARRAARPVMYLAQRWMCRRADTTLYVTEQSLQRKYPPSPRRPTFAATNAAVTEVRAPKHRAPSTAQLRVLTVGSMSQPYKGIDFLIEAVRLVRQGGVNAELVIVGDGRLRHDLEELANHRLGTGYQFLGQLPRGEVDREYMLADLFVLASLTEGFPRVLVEAMSKGLPCIGTNVGGIPELLDDSYIVEPRDSSAIADALVSLAQSSAAYLRASQRSIQRIEALLTHDPAGTRARFISCLSTPSPTASSKRCRKDDSRDFSRDH